MFKKIILTAAIVFTALSFVFQPMAAGAAWGTFTPDWSAIQADAAQVSTDALAVSAQAAVVMDKAQAIMNSETDADVLDAAQQIYTLAAQVESDANAIAVTADDINARIDGSEGTTLQLSQDILAMADEIGVMADRILYTEGEIGTMADRIVASENLISASSLSLAQDIAAITIDSTQLTAEIINLSSDMMHRLGS